MSRTCLRSIPLLAVLVLAGCAALLRPPGAPEGWPRFARAIVSYYEELAVERAGICRAPRILGFQRVLVRQRQPDRLVLEVHYAWHDEDYGDEEVLPARCLGFGVRIFVLDPASGRVLSMSGPTREDS